MARVMLMLILLLFAGTCFAEDPLETLNTVEDTVKTMQHSLKVHGVLPDPGAVGTDVESGVEGLYFVADEPIGTRGWVKVTPCTEEGAASLTAREFDTCASNGEGNDAASRPPHIWKSRFANPSDLRPGIVIVARDKEEGWFMAKITDLSELASGYVGTSAPFKAQLKGLRVVKE